MSPEASGPRVGRACAVLPARLVAAYAGGALRAEQAWSVEAHVPGCAACRAVLAGCGDSARLARNRSAVLARAGLPRPGPVGLVLRRCGVPGHVATLLAATPSLRRAWLAGVVLVLAIAVGAARLLAIGGPGAGWASLIPFLFLAPLLPLAAVAAAFSPRLDPAFRLVSAAPVSKVWLLLVRSVTVVAATLVPTAVAALALPGRHQWLAVALLLPALAVCAAALALTTVIRPAAAATAAGAGWTAIVAGLGVTAGQPASVVGPAGQVLAVAVLAAAIAAIVLRRNSIDYGWLG